MKLQQLLTEIDAKQAEIESYGKLDPEVLKKIQYKFRLDWNYHSNALEGNSLTKQETRSVMINNITVEGKPLKDVLDVRGHDQVVTEILKIGRGEVTLSEKRIKQIHKAIIHEDDPAKQGWAGQWKTANNHLFNYKGEKFEFTPWAEVPDKMHELVNWFNSERSKLLNSDEDSTHPALLAFDFHLRYVTIHPFYDGNGRTSRILMNLILVSFGYPPAVVRVEEKDTYNRYLADIQAYGGQPDLFYFFMAERLLKSQDLVLSAIRGEEIEDVDDVEKEIFLWKKQLKDSSLNEVLPRSNDVIFELYANSFRGYFQLLLDKLRQFEDIFTELQMKPLLNNSVGRGGLEYFDGKIQKWKSFRTSAVKPLHDVEVPVQSIEFWVALTGFKKAGINAFDVTSRTKIVFEPFRYVVTCDDQELGKFLYSQKITDEEAKEFVSSTVKRTFELIKRLASKDV